MRCYLKRRVLSGITTQTYFCLYSTTCSLVLWLSAEKTQVMEVGMVLFCYRYTQFLGKATNFPHFLPHKCVQMLSGYIISNTSMVNLLDTSLKLPSLLKTCSNVSFFYKKNAIVKSKFHKSKFIN